MRRVPSETERAEWALYKAESTERTIYSGGNTGVACATVAAACRAAAAEQRDAEPKPARIRPFGKANTAPPSLADKYDAVAADYERLSDLRAQAETLATELTRRVRNLEIEKARAAIDADPESPTEWRGDMCYVAGIHVAARARSHGVKCLAVWDAAADKVIWRRESADAPGMFSPEGEIENMRREASLSPMPSDANLQPA